MYVYALKPCHNRDDPVLDCGRRAAGKCQLQRRAAVAVVSVNPRLPAREGYCPRARAPQRDGQQRRGLILPRAHQRVKLARVRIGVQLVREGDKLIGRVAHGGDHHGDILPPVPCGEHCVCRAAQLFCIGEGAAAEFLNC